LSYLYGDGHTARAAWERGSDLTAETLAPRSRAALFRALAWIPGTSVERNVTDAAGRHGVAVRLTADGERSQLIFDGRTYAFLGEWSVQLKRLDDAPAGQVSYRALLGTGYVDEVGEFPR